MTESAHGEQQRFLQAFGAAVQRERQARGWSQDELAERAGLDPTVVGAAERGDDETSLGRLPALARALLLQPAELVPGWESFVDQQANPLRQEAQRRLRELVNGEAAGMPPLTPEGLAHIRQMEAELARARQRSE